MKNPITVQLQYPNDADIGRIVDHLTTVGKGTGAPRIIIDNPDADEYVKAVIERATGRGVAINAELSDRDAKRYTDNYDTDPSEPVVMGNMQGATSIEEQRAEQVNDNLVAVTDDERSPPGTPTAGREARAEKAAPPANAEPPRENPGFTIDTGEAVAERVEAEEANPGATTEARPETDQ